MVANLENLYRKIPEGYGKSLLRNIISFIIHHTFLGKERFIIDGIDIIAYKTFMYDNYNLTLEVSGYNRYYKLKEDNIVVDGGAYSGFFTIYAAKKVGSRGKVIAFEPDPFNYYLLKKNLALNKIKNVILVHKGLYSKDTILPFDVQGIGSSIVIGTNRKAINKIKVVSLDHELRRLKIPKVDFIKMDIEGGEIEAVKGCLDTMTKNPDLHFAIASYHLVNGKKTYLVLEKFFRSKRMEAVSEGDKHLTTYVARQLRQKK